MMRFLLWLLVAVAVVCGVTWAVSEHNGYVMFAWKNLRYESSLWAFLLLLGLCWLGFVLLRATWRVLQASGGMLNPWSKRSLGRRQKKAASAGQVALLEGRWAGAMRHLGVAAEGEQQPLLFYIGAARAAHKLGQREDGEALLERALERYPQAELAIALSHAEMQEDVGDVQGALNTLQAMRSRYPHQPWLLERLQHLLRRQGDWSTLLGLLPELRKANALTSAQLQELEQQVWSGRLCSAAGEGEQALQQAWQCLSAAQRKDPQLSLAYAQGLYSLGAEGQAEEVLRKALKQGYRSDLIDLYGQLRGADLTRQLHTAEDLLKQHPHDPHLLLALARLCLQNQLWGKAYDYLELSLSQQRLVPALIELARLLASQGQHAQSNQLLQELLQLQGQTLSRLPQPLP